MDFFIFQLFYQMLVVVFRQFVYPFYLDLSPAFWFMKIWSEKMFIKLKFLAWIIFSTTKWMKLLSPWQILIMGENQGMSKYILFYITCVFVMICWKWTEVWIMAMLFQLIPLPGTAQAKIEDVSRLFLNHVSQMPMNVPMIQVKPCVVSIVVSLWFHVIVIICLFLWRDFVFLIWL